MKKYILLLSFIAFSSSLFSQTFYYNNSFTLNSWSFTSCQPVAITLDGSFSDGCSYFPANADYVTVSGIDIVFHIPVRNMGCDSGWMCTMALVPVTVTKYFDISFIPSGTYNYSVQFENICQGTMFPIITTSQLVIQITSTAVNTVTTLSSNAPSTIQIGTPITYTATTNVAPNFTSYWYRNGVLSTTQTNGLAWSTNQLTNFDTVKVKIVSDTVCTNSNTIWSNSIITIVNPNSLNDVTKDDLPNCLYNSNNHTLNFYNLKPNDRITMYDISGRVVKIV